MSDYVPAPLTVYVPASEDTLGIKPGSAIVGSHPNCTCGGDDPNCPSHEVVRIDYEGGLYGSSNMNSYEDCLLHAADRHVWNQGRGYPTVARMHVPTDKLHRVGFYDPVFHQLVVDDHPALDAWKSLWRPGR